MKDFWDSGLYMIIFLEIRSYVIFRAGSSKSELAKISELRTKLIKELKKLKKCDINKTFLFLFQF